MLISLKYKLIFIHIYKTGGNFVRTFLRKLDPNILSIAPAHILAKEAKKKIPSIIWDNFKKICIVRNSYDWQVSLYSYVKGLKTHHQHEIIKDMNFKEYLQWRQSDLHQQLLFILDDNKKPLIDNILKFENLNNDLIDFFHNNYNIDISKILPKKKINTSKRNSDYRTYYTEEDKEFLYELHKPDIEYFNFTF